MDNVELVKAFLRAQNLEQLGRLDEAVSLYEEVIAGGFDSSGPYDRLIAIYANQARHGDVVRVARTALEQVHTYGDKQALYERMRHEAERAQRRVPSAAPKRAE